MNAAAPSSILLYRFLDAAAALKTIEERRFRISRLRDLNDPFEWRFGYKGIKPEVEPKFSAWLDSIIEKQNKLFGLICFSDTAKEPVLWSHYADKHHGVALEVDYLNNPEHLIQMHYTSERLVIDAEKISEFQSDESYRKDYMLPMLLKMIRQKSPGWASEREYRVHFDLLNEIDLQTSGGFYFKRIPDSFLMRVILGWKCPLEEEYVTKALKASGLTSTKVVRAKLSPDYYTVQY
jgi:hypothetical protein